MQVFKLLSVLQYVIFLLITETIANDRANYLQFIDAGNTQRDTFLFGSLIQTLAFLDLPTQAIYIFPILSLALLLYYLAPNIKKAFGVTSEFPILFIILLLWFGFFNVSAFVQLRAGFSLSLCLCAYSCQVKKAYVSMIIFSILAVSIHMLALLFVVFQLILIVSLWQYQKFRLDQLKLPPLRLVMCIVAFFFASISLIFTLNNKILFDLFLQFQIPNPSYYFNSYFSSERSHSLGRVPHRFYIAPILALASFLNAKLRRAMSLALTSTSLPYVVTTLFLYGIYLVANLTVALKVASPFLFASLLIFLIALIREYSGLYSFIRREPLLILILQFVLSMFFVFKAS